MALGEARIVVIEATAVWMPRPTRYMNVVLLQCKTFGCDPRCKFLDYFCPDLESSQSV